MKRRMLTVFASLTIIVGVFVVIAATIYGWGTWSGMEGGIGWLDFQLANKAQVPFFAKAIALLIAGGAFWIFARQLINREAAAKRTAMAIIGVGLAFAIGGITLWMIQQADFLYRNQGIVQTLRTILYVVAGVLLIVGSLGTIARERKAYWLLIGLFIVGICVNFANLIIVVAYPVIISVTGSHDWLTRWGVEALFFLALNTIALFVLLWMRTELDNPAAESKEAGNKRTALKLS